MSLTDWSVDLGQTCEAARHGTKIIQKIFKFDMAIFIKNINLLTITTSLEKRQLKTAKIIC